MDTGRSLSREEFDEVIRRAARLAAEEGDPSGELLESELFRIAREVGIPEHHVRRALADVRTEADWPRDEPEGAGPVGAALDRIFGAETVGATRTVPGAAGSLAERLDRFLVSAQLLQPVRRGPHVLQYRPAVDWVSRIARSASSTSRRYYVASARSVAVRLIDTGEPDRTLVRIDVDPGTRGDAISGAAAGGILVGGGLGTGVAVSLAAAAPDMAAVAGGLAVGGGLFAAIASFVGGRQRRRLDEVRDEVEGILDRLEAGEELDPPPASWRRWVERYFHGAVRHDELPRGRRRGDEGFDSD